MGTGPSQAGCPWCSVLLGHVFSPPCKPSPSVSTSELPLPSPLASPPVPGDPKPAARCPSCAAATFSCCQEKGSCSCLRWKKQQLFFPPSVASRAAGLLVSLSLASPTQAVSHRRWTLQELLRVPVELGGWAVLGKTGAWLCIQLSFVLSCLEEIRYRKRLEMRMLVHVQNWGCGSS